MPAVFAAAFPAASLGVRRASASAPVDVHEPTFAPVFAGPILGIVVTYFLASLLAFAFVTVLALVCLAPAFCPTFCFFFLESFLQVFVPSGILQEDWDAEFGPVQGELGHRIFVCGVIVGGAFAFYEVSVVSVLDVDNFLDSPAAVFVLAW